VEQGQNTTVSPSWNHETQLENKEYGLE